MTTQRLCGHITTLAILDLLIILSAFLLEELEHSWELPQIFLVLFLKVSDT